MLTTILVGLLAWSVLGGALAIADADEGLERDLPAWFLIAVYGPALWLTILCCILAELWKLACSGLERKLRGK